MNKTIPYIEILKKSGKIVWRNRYLWWFGFFVALGSLSGTNYSYDLGKVNSPASQQKIFDFASQNIHWVAIGLIIFLILYLIFIILSVVGRGALIYSANQQAEEKPVSFKIGFKKGKVYFWKLFLIAFLLGLFMFSSIIILAIPVIFLFYVKSYLIGVFMAILAALIIIPLIILAVYVKIYAYLYTVLGQFAFWPAIENSYNLFRKNLASSLVMGLLFIPINIFWGIVSIMAIVPITISFLVIGLVIFFIAGKIGAIIIAAVGIASIIILLLIIRSIYEAFAQTLWVLFFREIARTNAKEAIVEPEPEFDSIAKPLPIIESEKE